jgi:ankyrin repeat protein
VQVEGLIADGVQPSTLDTGGRSGAHFAASRGELQVLELLHSKGVDIDAEDERGRTPLHYAALGNHEACVKFLADRGCWLDATDADDCTPMHCAAMHGAEDAVIRLIKARATADLRNRWGLAPAGATLPLCQHVISTLPQPKKS